MKWLAPGAKMCAALNNHNALNRHAATIARFVRAPKDIDGILHIAPALADFQALYPDVSIDMSLEDRQVDLVEDAYDLAIRIAELPDSSLIARRLGPCRHVLCASPDYLQRHGTPRSPDELQSHNALTYGYHESPGQWHFISPQGRVQSVSVHGSMQMNNSLALREAVLNGAGITLTPTFIVGPDIKSGRLQALLPGYRTMELSIYAVYHQRRHVSPKVRAFVEFMANRISAAPHWDSM